MAEFACMAIKKKKPAKAAPKKAAKKAPVKKAAKPAKAKAPAKKKVVAKPAKKVAAKAPVVAKAPAVKKHPVKKEAAPKPMPMPVEKAKKVKEPKVEEPVVETAEADATPEEATDRVLTDAQGRHFCRVKDCDQVAVVDAYCRYHYLMYWKKIQVRKKILSEGRLERYIEELTARYPDKFLDTLRKDLRSEKEFLAAIQELEIDESATDSEFEEESQTFIDEVRGMSETTPERGDDEF
jgi:hypothetical protein